MSRPKLPDLERRTIRLELYVSMVEQADIQEAARQSGMGVAAWLRDVVLRGAKPSTEANSRGFEGRKTPETGRIAAVLHPSKLHHEGFAPLKTTVPDAGETFCTPQNNSLESLPIPSDNESKNTQQVHEETAVPERDPARTSASARTQKEEENQEKGSQGSSLRSERPAAAQRGLEPDLDPDPPWDAPPPSRMKIKLSSGESVDNIWMFANGCRISREDVSRLLNTPQFKPLRQAMLTCFARSLRDTYKLRWCSKHNKRVIAWKDRPSYSRGFKAAAEYLANEYATRGMTANQFIDACDEMKPRSLKFVTPDLMGGATGARVSSWLPQEERRADKAWTTHEDHDGHTWITPDGESPVLVIRSAADRERYLKAIKAT